MPEVDPRQLAADYFRQAYESQIRGDYDQALELYTRSIEAYPTAEAYTFRGWTYSFLGKLDEAIEECLQAIKVDPDFGNPYNDIGAYLIEKDKWQEAIPWLEKATVARRYEAPYYAWFNLGRVHERLRNWRRARECYRRAFELNPKYGTAIAALRRLQAMWN
jgi:Tfp pilus assembly protein PilF